MEVALPKIKITDAQSQSQSLDAAGVNVKLPTSVGSASVSDGGHFAKPLSGNEEESGFPDPSRCLHSFIKTWSCPRRLLLGAVMTVAQFYQCYILVVALLLTKCYVLGNQPPPLTNGKKATAKALRNTTAVKEPIKDSTEEKQTSPPLRPSTAIDPLSHVWTSWRAFVEVCLQGQCRRRRLWKLQVLIDINSIF